MNRVQKAAVIIITLLLVVLGTAYGAGYFYFGSHFLPGTELNEFDVSFKTAAEVQDLLDQKVKSYAIAVEERNGGREKIDARSIGMKYKPGGTVQKLLSGQDRLLWFIPESSFEKTDLGFVLDEKLLEEQISGLDCMQNMSAPTDARILYKEGEGFILIPEKEGSKVDLEQASELIDTAIRRGESSVDISGCYEEPKIRQADLEKKYETLKKFQDVIITYDFGDRTETLDIGKIRDLIVDDELNREKVSAYVEELAAKYDTKGTERNFVTYDDRKIKVSGGNYGWKIDQEKETDGLMNAILSGQTDVRTPVYEQEAKERDSNDIGYTYIEVDKENSQFILYVDGNPVIQTTGISGSLENGVYSLKKPVSEEDGKNWCLPFGSGQCIYGADMDISDETSDLDTAEETDSVEDLQIDDLEELLSDPAPVPEEDGCFAVPEDSARDAFSQCKKGMPVIIY